jgi:hypothetical protein
VRAWLPLAMVLAGAYLGVAMISPPAFGLWQDDAVYVVTARSLAEGSGYRHLEMPQQPLQTKYPPLFPALLAVVFRLWGDWPANLPALHAVTAVSGAVFVLLAWRYVARGLGGPRTMVAAVAALSAVSPVLICLNRFLMSELPYAAMAVGAMLVLDRRLGPSPPARGTWRWVVPAAALIVAAMMTRTLGLSLAPAGVAVLLWRRRWAQASALAGLVGAAWLAYGYWQHQAALANGPLQSAPLFAYDLDYAVWIPRSLPRMARVMWQNAFRLLMALGVFHLALPKAWATSALQECSVATFALQGVCWLAAALLGVGFVSSMRRGLRTVHLYALTYTALMLAWPCEPYRFLAPWAPFILYFIFEGAATSAGWLGRGRIPVKAAVAVVAVVLAGLFIFEDTQILSSTRQSYYFWGNQIRDFDQLDELAGWIRRHTPDRAVIASPRTCDFHLSTGRRFVQAWTSDDPVAEYYSRDRTWWSFYAIGANSELVDIYQRMSRDLWPIYRRAGVNYCVWDGSVRLLDPLRYVAAEQPERFRLCFVSSGRSLAVYEVLAPPASQPAATQAAAGG